MKKTMLGLALSFFGLMAMSSQAIAVNCPIKIGGLAPLSAPGSVTGGEAMRVAMLLAERDIFVAPRGDVADALAFREAALDPAQDRVEVVPPGLGPQPLDEGRLDAQVFECGRRRQGWRILAHRMRLVPARGGKRMTSPRSTVRMS